MRESDTYDVEHEGKFIKSSRVLEKDVSEYLPLAFKVDELVAAQILAIEGSELDPSLTSTIVADFFYSGTNKEEIGSLYINLNTNETEAEDMQFEIKRSFMEDQASGTDTCTLILTQYGDMRSFISDSSQK